MNNSTEASVGKSMTSGQSFFFCYCLLNSGFISVKSEQIWIYRWFSCFENLVVIWCKSSKNGLKGKEFVHVYPVEIQFKIAIITSLNLCEILRIESDCFAGGNNIIANNSPITSHGRRRQSPRVAQPHQRQNRKRSRQSIEISIARCCLNWQAT